MNNKQKEVLQHHRNFLLRNIVWSDDLANKMLADGIITDLTMKEIQSLNRHGKHQDRKKLLKVLDTLPVRGEAVFAKFCDLLHVHGHPFIADLLRDEESGNLSEISGVKEIYKLVPALEKALKDTDKRAIEEFIIEKAKETSLKASWSKDAVAREKHKTIKAMEKQLEDAFEYEEKEKQRNEEISKLKVELEEEKKHVVELKSELGYMKSELQNTETKMRSDFGVQMKFSLANENALRKLTDKHEQCTQMLSSLDAKIKSNIVTPSRSSEKDQMALAEFPFAFILSDLESLVSKYKSLLDIQKQFDSLLHERNYILAQLGVHEKDENKPSLLTAYRDFAVRNDEDLTELKHKLSKHTDVIEGQKDKIDNLSKEVEKQSQFSKMKTAGTAWQNALLTVMRKQLNDVKVENRKQDTKLRTFESENAKLKARIAELEARREAQAVHTTLHAIREPLTTEAVRSRRDSYQNEENDSTISAVTEANRKRNVSLPPLGGKYVYQQTVDMGMSTHDLSPKRQKPKPRQTWDSRHNALNPESLITAQLKLENKGMPVPSPLGGKYGSHRLGDLKTMHGKAGIYK